MGARRLRGHAPRRIIDAGVALHPEVGAQAAPAGQDPPWDMARRSLLPTLYSDRKKGVDTPAKASYATIGVLQHSMGSTAVATPPLTNAHREVNMRIRIPLSTKIATTLVLGVLLTPPLAADENCTGASGGEPVYVCDGFPIHCPSGTDNTMVCQDNDICNGMPGWRIFCDGEPSGYHCCEPT